MRKKIKTVYQKAGLEFHRARPFQLNPDLKFAHHRHCDEQILIRSVFRGFPFLQAAENELFTVGADADQHDGDSADFFDMLNILLSVFRKILEFTGI